MTRRHRKLGILGMAGTVTLLLSACLGTGTATEPVVEDAEGPLTIQSRLAADSGDAAALQAVVDAFNAKGGGQVEINTVPNETFRDQLPSYLTSSNPPDVLTLYGGALTRELADEGLLLDISDVWEGAEFSDGLRALSTDSAGNEVFVPTSYYWLGVYYKKSVWEAAGAEVPTTWDEFLAAAEALQANGVIPIGIALSDAPWLASAWFDYLNLRVNGANFHLDLLAGELERGAHRCTTGRLQVGPRGTTGGTERQVYARLPAEGNHGDVDLGPQIGLVLERREHLAHRVIEGLDLAVDAHATGHVGEHEHGQWAGGLNSKFLETTHGLAFSVTWTRGPDQAGRRISRSRSARGSLFR
jgi:hypothetical protein